MNGNRLFFAAIISLLLLSVVGCEKEEGVKREIEKNHNITACGVKDPLTNIEWFKTMCDKIELKSNDINVSFNIDLYYERGTGNNLFLIPYNPDKGTFDYAVYNCEGELTDYDFNSLPRTGDKYEFPEDPLDLYCEYMGTIWSLKIIE